MPQDQDLQDLVDAPRETLSVEVKGSLDLTDQTARANLARHVCALANHGGGYVVFGFDDDLNPITLAGDVDANYHRDRIASAVSTYLEPPPHCDVTIVTSSEGRRHPVVRVPALGTTPVCAKANGPNDARGRPQGIQAGRHYTRQLGANGPESAHVTSPAQWSPIIRRCVIADRQSLVGMFEHVLNPTPQQPVIDDLRLWHDNTAAAFARVVEREQLQWSTPLVDNYAQYSYALVLDQHEIIPEGELLDALQRVNARVRDLVWTGWSMFYPFQREGIAPYFIHDAAPEDVAVVEAQLLGGRRLTASSPDFWRVSNDGKASIIRPYGEDRSSYPLGPGRTISPEGTTAEIAEIVRHASEMAALFQSVRAVRFRCEWRGLVGRTFRGEHWNFGGAPRTDRVVSAMEFPLLSLSNEWPMVVSTLIGRLVRAFDPRLELEPLWVERQSSHFRSPYLRNTD